MSNRTTQQSKRPTRGQDALSRYRAALEEIYPKAKGRTNVVKGENDGIFVCVPLPTRVSERMRLFDRMAKVGTDLLLETGQYIILTSQ